LSWFTSRQAAIIEEAQPSRRWNDIKPIRWLRRAASDDATLPARSRRLRQPLGPTGLPESLKSFTDEIGRDSGIRFHHDVHEIDLPALVARLVFHIARKA